MNNLPEVTIVCDGSVYPNPGFGGYASVLLFTVNGETVEKTVAGRSSEVTTNQRMELVGLISALQTLSQSYRVEVFSDSQYLVKGVNYWIALWERRKWENSEGNPVMNQDLWKQIVALKKIHKINCRHVKGHNGNGLNEKVHLLANEARLNVA